MGSVQYRYSFEDGCRYGIGRWANGLAVGVLFLRKDIRGLSMLSLNKKQHFLSYE
ncbi:hypothetical protein DO70_2282 [Burkholderia pseudomallei]|nr:hypothetical protein DO70_2282 [Burkholderia pseudomallei]